MDPWSALNSMNIFSRVGLQKARRWTRIARPFSTAEPTPGAKPVRTRIVLEALPHDEDTRMNIRNWLNEDDTQLNHRILSTLNTAELKSTDYTILSHAVHPSVAFLPRTQSFPIRFFKKDSTYQPFPPGTRGFLYFRPAPQHLHPMAGGLRFRITPAAHPATFSTGYDLLHQGLPWQVALRNIATATGPKVVLRDQLLHEGLITQEELDKCLAATPQKKRIDPKLTLYHLNQPFPVTFDQSSYVWIVGRSESKCWVYAYMFADNRKDFRPLVRPYSGSALAQFELSTLPEHAGTETLVMRIVKMLQAPTCVLPDYDGYIPPPVEGELVRRPMGHARATRVQPWHCDVSGPSDSAAILRMLVQNHKEGRVSGAVDGDLVSPSKPASDWVDIFRRAAAASGSTTKR